MPVAPTRPGRVAVIGPTALAVALAASALITTAVDELEWLS